MKLALVVDDEEEIRNLLRDELDLEGFRVALAESGNAAIRALSAGLRPDLVLTDMRMADGSGLDLLRYFANQWPKPVPPIFIVSAFLDVAVEALAGLPYTAILAKPFDRLDLISQIRSSVDPDT